MRIIRHYAYVPFSPPLSFVHSFHAPSASYCVLTISIHKRVCLLCVCVCVCETECIHTRIRMCMWHANLLCTFAAKLRHVNSPACTIIATLPFTPQKPKWAFDFGFAFVSSRMAVAIGGGWGYSDTDSDLGAKVCECVISIAFSA